MQFLVAWVQWATFNLCPGLLTWEPAPGHISLWLPILVQDQEHVFFKLSSLGWSSGPLAEPSTTLDHCPTPGKSCRLDQVMSKSLLALKIKMVNSSPISCYILGFILFLTKATKSILGGKGKADAIAVCLLTNIGTAKGTLYLPWGLWHLH